MWAFSVVAVAVAVPAAKAQRTSSLGWARLPGAESCISTQLLAERVERRLGRRVFVSASQSQLALEGRVEWDAEAGAWVANLVISDRRGRVLGRRVLRAAGERCEVLDDSLTLVIAIAIDPGASLSPQPAGTRAISKEAERMLEQLDLPQMSEEEMLNELALQEAPDEPEPPPKKEAEPAPETAPPEPPPPAPTTVLELGLSAVGTTGILPQVGPGLELMLGLQPPSFWVLEFGLEALAPQEASSFDGRASLALWSAAAALCPLSTRDSTLTLRACLGGRLGALFAEGAGFTRDRAPAGPWVEAVAYARLLWNFPVLFLQAQLCVGAPLVRDRFTYVDRDERLQRLHRAALPNGRVGLGVGLRFR